MNALACLFVPYNTLVSCFAALYAVLSNCLEERGSGRKTSCLEERGSGRVRPVFAA
jgi:hypothetical protein